MGCCTEVDDVKFSGWMTDFSARVLYALNNHSEHIKHRKFKLK